MRNMRAETLSVSAGSIILDVTRPATALCDGQYRRMQVRKPRFLKEKKMQKERARAEKTQKERAERKTLAKIRAKNLRKKKEGT